MHSVAFPSHTICELHFYNENKEENNGSLLLFSEWKFLELLDSTALVVGNQVFPQGLKYSDWQFWLKDSLRKRACCMLEDNPSYYCATDAFLDVCNSHWAVWVFHKHWDRFSLLLSLTKNRNLEERKAVELQPLTILNYPKLNCQ